MWTTGKEVFWPTMRAHLLAVGGGDGKNLPRSLDTSWAPQAPIQQQQCTCGVGFVLLLLLCLRPLLLNFEDLFAKSKLPNARDDLLGGLRLVHETELHAPFCAPAVLDARDHSAFAKQVGDILHEWKPQDCWSRAHRMTLRFQTKLGTDLALVSGRSDTITWRWVLLSCAMDTTGSY